MYKYFPEYNQTKEIGCVKTVNEVVESIFLNSENFEFEEFESYTSLEPNDIVHPEQFVVAFNQAVRDKNVERNKYLQNCQQNMRKKSRMEFLRDTIIASGITYLIIKILP